MFGLVALVSYVIVVQGKTRVDDFFREKSSRSEVKVRIIAKYFHAWARVVKSAARAHSGRLAYIDLFAGPGRYLDDSKSTPLLVLEDAIKDPDMREMLVSIFNDADRQHTHALEKAIAELPGVDSLRYPPAVRTNEVGDQLVRGFEEMKLVPTFFFVDPWGYKGLSLRLVNSVLKDWGCDCAFFFNYNRINMGLMNPRVRSHMDQLFGSARAEALRAELTGLDRQLRERKIIEALMEALRELGGKFVQPFAFKNEDGTRTSHHLIFVSKDFRGYDIMKPIMAMESSTHAQGVPSFVYNPNEIRNPTLFETSRPLDELKKSLLHDYGGRRISMRQLYEEHSVGKPYLARNYKEALRQLEARNLLAATPPVDKRPKRSGQVTFADNVIVAFPDRTNIHGR